ncbi:MAG: polysaccharide pyruvyl transferase family protein [Verrucomicrobiales bacterium]|nr:polysaccharide pyruvyl transferase family protein [Verrucomicrobiales bacterium]
MKVAFVGAWGYGNVGDNTYRILWQRFFPDLDAVYFNSDLPPDGLDREFGLVVFGGGGLLWHNEGNAHLEYMTYYVNEAKRFGIPYGFVSCDLQVRRVPGSDDADAFDYEPVVNAWLPNLRDAAFVWLRSVRSVDVLAKEGIVAEYCPDLCYLFRPDNVLTSRRYITIIPGFRVKAENPAVMADLELARGKWPDAVPILLNMGGPVADEVTAKFGGQLPEIKVYLSDEVTPEVALEKISSSHYVLSGRYHGMIFSRACGVPVRTYARSQYKIEVESALPLGGDPWRNVLALQEVLRDTGITSTN